MTVARFEHIAGSQDLSGTEIMQQYGVLPWREDKHGRGQVLLITSRGHGRWIVPKGWPIHDRAPYLSAALEAFEEAGVIGEVLPHPLGTYHYVKEGEDGATQYRRVTLFSLRVVGTLTNWPERGQRKRQWFSLSEAADMVDNRELARIICAIHDAPQMLTERNGRVSNGDKRFEGPLTT